jgi:GNAT superfamily N-acetyltransferase
MLKFPATMICISTVLLLCLIPYTYTQAASFEHKKDNLSFLQDNIITLTHDHQEIGFLHYVKLPFMQWYVIHNFFIKKKCRKKGYGKKLFQEALDRLSLKKASKIFVQPGAFEIDIPLSAQEKKERMPHLVKFYEEFGFAINENKYFYRLLKIAYKIGKLQEDAQMFMVKEQEPCSKNY